LNAFRQSEIEMLNESLGVTMGSVLFGEAMFLAVVWLLDSAK
jgi:hypothetical protein